MINEKTARELKKLFENVEFARRFSAAEDFAELKALFADNGLVLSDEELKEIIETLLLQIEHSNNAELNEDQLDNVAGGFVGWVIAGGVMAVVGGISAYKLRKHLNSISPSCRKG